MNKIPFAKPYLGVEEEMAVLEVLRSGNLARGKKVKEFEEKFAEYVGAKYAVAFNGCTASLRSAIDVLILPPEVKVPAITFTATASVVVDSGRTPVFVDVDENLLAEEADIPVHLAGRRVKGDALIFDSAHRIEKDDMIGSKAIWCYSFYATKNLTTGYGGMACTNNIEHYRGLKLIQDDGRVKTKPTYSVIQAVGGRDMNDIAAAIGLEQLKKLSWMTEQRNRVVARYNKNFKLNHVGNHLYPILVEKRNDFIKLMNQNEVQCSVHFKPLHKEPAYEKYCDYSLPNAELLGERLVSLPLFPTLTNEEVDYISDKILKIGLFIQK